MRLKEDGGNAGSFAIIADMGYFALAKQAGHADKRLDEIWRADSLLYYL